LQRMELACRKVEVEARERRLSNSKRGEQRTCFLQSLTHSYDCQLERVIIISLYHLIPNLITNNTPHNFALPSFLASSLKIRFKIFPEAFLGIASTHLIPPSSILKEESLSRMYSCTCWSPGPPLPPGRRTI
jgi:hypothetical protein